MQSTRAPPCLPPRGQRGVTNLPPSPPASHGHISYHKSLLFPPPHPRAAAINTQTRPPPPRKVQIHPRCKGTLWWGGCGAAPVLCVCVGGLMGAPPPHPEGNGSRGEKQPPSPGKWMGEMGRRAGGGMAVSGGQTDSSGGHTYGSGGELLLGDNQVTAAPQWVTARCHQVTISQHQVTTRCDGVTNRCQWVTISHRQVTVRRHWVTSGCHRVTVTPRWAHPRVTR